MQKHLSLDTSFYWYVLTETEWYAAPEAQKNTLRADCKREAEENGCKYANIFVDPDPIMSVCSTPKRHIVWKASADHPTMDFKVVLHDICERALAAGIPKDHIRIALASYISERL